ncbi:hypothetical protein K2X05_10890, partial [bacterium]|nr:hypothetical protein [bacterium]
KNKLSEKTALLYGFFYSNNAAVLPGLPIPALTYEISDKTSGDLFRIGFPLIIRQNNILPQTQWGLFAIGPVLWDLFVKNSSMADVPITLGIQKRPDTFLLSEPIPGSPLNQLMVEHIASYALIEWRVLNRLSLGLKFAYNFNNHFRLRETGTTRDDFDLNRRFSDYAFWGLNLKILAPAKNP